MLTTKRNQIASLAGLMIAALMSHTGAADGREEALRGAQRTVVGATPAVAGVVGLKAEPDRIRAEFERLTEREIKDVYGRCNEEALASRLAKAEIALCSIAYDVLLKQHFHGEFEALLAWSRGL